MNPPVTNTAAAAAPTNTLSKWRRRMALAGVLLAFVCRFVPDDYRKPCEVLAEICTLGL